ncbi:MAG: hypothetical protein V1676_05645, partial [Candidatus Diapherotrites archaeon]
KMFGNKGQSALEYLMTYGWALVVIVIAIAALVFLINPTQIGAEGCTGLAKLPIRAQSVTCTGAGGACSSGTYTVIFTNMTGQNLTGATLTFTGNLIDTNTLGAISANEEKRIISTLGTNDTFTSKGTYTVNLSITYTDSDGFSRTSTASCKGRAP